MITKPSTDESPVWATNWTRQHNRAAWKVLAASRGTARAFARSGSQSDCRPNHGPVSIFLFIIVFLFPFSPYAQNLSGYDIIKKQQDLGEGYHDEVATGTMVTRESNGSETKREFILKTLEESSQSGTRTLIKILSPADLLGTGLLSIIQGRANDQWLYLPALKKTKRIAGQSKKGLFLGSEFSFEDLLPKSMDQYKYTYINKKACGASECFLVESTPLFSGSIYSKSILLVRTDNFQSIQIDFYDTKGRLFKQATFSNYAKLKNKFWRPFQISMKNILNHRETRFLVNKHHIQTGLQITEFSLHHLEQ